MMFKMLVFDRSQTFVFSMTETHGILMDYVEFEGEKYLCSLTKKSGCGHPPRIPKYIYICEDHRGIREVVFADSMDAALQVDPVDGIYWKTLSTPKPDGVLEFSSDVRTPNLPVKSHEYETEYLEKGVKIRHLTYSHASRRCTTLNLPSFSVPQDPRKQFRFYPLFKGPPLSPPRLSLFRYNRSDITGLSICCSPAPIAFHAHTPKDDLSFYQSAPAKSAWVYVPLQDNEHVKRIWMRAPLRMRRAFA